jgi:opacity protein-like surface antigen
LLRSPLKLLFAFVLVSIASHAQIAQPANEPVEAASSSTTSTVTAGAAQAGGQDDPQLPKPGQPGSPFQVDHFWRHISLELAGGYSPILDRGAGFYGPGYTATAGAVYRLNERWRLLAEGQILGQHGNLNFPACDVLESCTGQNASSYAVASYIVAFHLDALYNLRPHADTSPYLIGGGGYYHLGTHSVCVGFQGSNSGCTSTSDDPFTTDLTSVNAAGFNGGAGVRHRLFADRHTEIFADVRYHFIASGSSSVGRISVLPIGAGIRW